MVIGAVVALVPLLPIIEVLVLIQVLNALLMALVMAFMLLLVNDRGLVGELANRRLTTNVIGVTTWAALLVLVEVLVGGQMLALAGIGPFAA